MPNWKGKTDHPDDPDGPSDDPPAAERRRIAKVLHDERGNARVEWSRAQGHLERTPLSLEDGPPGTNPERGYNPYEKTARPPAGRLPERERERRPKRDLRRLSDWIKRMRELEERKSRGEPDGED